MTTKHNRYDPHIARTGPGMVAANAEYTLKALLALMDFMFDDDMEIVWPSDLSPPPGWERASDETYIKKSP